MIKREEEKRKMIKDQLYKEKLSHKGVFDYQGFYRYAYDWFYNNKNYNVLEEKYSEGVSGNKRNITFEWVASKEFSDYFKIEIKVKTVVTDLVDVEVEIDGEKKKMNKGGISMELKCFLVYDPGSKWAVSPWYKFLRDVYDKYVIPNRVDSMKDIAKGDVDGFKEEMKAYLEIYGRL